MPTSDSTPPADASHLGSAPSLADEKLRREIYKLDREIEKLDIDLREGRRPYVLRNPQTITAAVVTLGAIIGLSVATYKDYFGMLRDQAKFISDQAAASKDAAAAAQAAAAKEMAAAKDTKAAAEEKMVEANAEFQSAQKLKDDAATLSKQAIAQQQRDRKAVATAARQASIANDAAFKASSSPPFLREIQNQLTSLDLVNTRSFAYGWITSPSLKVLAVGSEEDRGTGKFDNGILATIPTSVEDLTIIASGGSRVSSKPAAEPITSLDLGVIPSIGALKRLHITLGTSTMPLVSIRNLQLAKLLDYLDLNLEGSQIEGVDAIQKLPNLKQLRLVICHPESFSTQILERANALVLKGTCNVDEGRTEKQTLIRIRNSKKLKSLDLSYLDIDSFRIIQSLPAIDTLSIKGFENDIDRNASMPQIKVLAIYPYNASEAGRMLNAFPNVQDLSISIRSSDRNKMGGLQALLESLPARYPSLHSLTVDANLDAAPENALAVPVFGELSTLRLIIETGEDQGAPVDLPSANLSNLKQLEIISSSLRSGQLAKLHHLNTLLLDYPGGNWLTELEQLDELRTLGINLPARPYEFLNNPDADPVQRMIARLPLERLYIPAYDIFLSRGTPHFPTTLRRLDLSNRAFIVGHYYGENLPTPFSGIY